jgi:hypothetical protein
MKDRKAMLHAAIAIAGAERRMRSTGIESKQLNELRNCAALEATERGWLFVILSGLQYFYNNES